MLSIKAVVYKSYLRADKIYPIKIRVTYKRKSRYFDTPLAATQKQLSKDLEAIKDYKLCSAVCRLVDNMRELLYANAYAINSIDDVVRIVSGENKKLPSVATYGKQLYEQMLKQHRAHTAGNYRTALARLSEFSPTAQFSDININFLKKYESYLSQKMGQRGVQLYLSCLRKIYNAAIDEFNADGIERIKPSPFQHFKIQEPAPTKKRALTTSQLQAIANVQTTDKKAIFARDVFLLSFMFCGINTIDLFTINELTDTTLSYNRSKTKNKRKDGAYISIAIHQQAQALVAKYRDGSKFTFSKLYATPYNFNKAVNKGLKIIGELVGIENLQFYAARHSWATIARNDCNVSVDDVALALCHSQKSVTDIYIKKDFSRIDAANAKVIELVFPKSE